MGLFEIHGTALRLPWLHEYARVLACDRDGMPRDAMGFPEPAMRILGHFRDGSVTVYGSPVTFHRNHVTAFMAVS